MKGANGVTRILPPCKDRNGAPCGKREVGCQSRCKAYKEYRQTVETVRAAERNTSMLNGYCAAAVESTIKYGGLMTPKTMIRNAQKREERRLRNAKVKVNAKSR